MTSGKFNALLLGTSFNFALLRDFALTYLRFFCQLCGFSNYPTDDEKATQMRCSGLMYYFDP